MYILAVTTINSNKTTTIHPLFIVTKHHTTLKMILSRMYDVMQSLLHEESKHPISVVLVNYKSITITKILYV